MFEFLINGPWYVIPAVTLAILTEVIYDANRIKKHTGLKTTYIYIISIIISLIIGTLLMKFISG